MLLAIVYLSTSSHLSIFFAILLARLSWLYDVIICLVRLTQMFATADHYIKMFSKVAIFLPNQFIKTLICDLISQPIFKLSSTNQRLDQGDADSV